MSNHRNVIVHVHIFKNAGSSLDGALERNFQETFIDHREDHLIRTNEEFLKEFLQKHENIQAFSSHSVYFKPRSFDNVNLHPIYMLRHPIERIKSVYSFEKKQPVGDSLGAKMAKQFNFEEYVSWRMQDDVPPTIRNLQTVFLAGANHHANHIDKKYQLALETLNESPLIGVVDRYDESMVVFEEYLKPFFPDIDLSYVRKNVTDTNTELSVEEKANKILMQFDAKMQDKIKENNKYDLELYERANTLLDEKIEKIDNFREKLYDFKKRCMMKNGQPFNHENELSITSMIDKIMQKVTKKKKVCIEKFQPAQKVFIQANCQSHALRHMFQKLSRLNKKYEIMDVKPVHLWKDEDKNDIFEKIRICDIFLHQPISEVHFGQFSSNTLKEHLKESAVSISFPNLYFTGYHPQAFYLKDEHGKKVLEPFDYHDKNIIEFFKEGLSAEQVISKIKEDSFYTPEEIKKNVDQSLIDLRTREKETDIKLSNYIEENMIEKKLFHIFNHPSNEVLFELFDRVLLSLNENKLTDDEKLLFKTEMLGQIQFPIYPSVQKYFEINEKLSLVRLKEEYTLGDMVNLYFKKYIELFETKIPKQIVQYWDTNEIPEEIQLLMDSWKTMNPDYSYKLFNREQAIEYLLNRYGEEITNYFKMIKLPAMQSDIFRIAYILQEGGIYVDAGFKCLENIHKILTFNSELVLMLKWNNNIANGFIMSTKNNKVISKIFDKIISNIKEKTIDNVWLLSGPGVFMNVINNLSEEEKTGLAIYPQEEHCKYYFDIVNDLAHKKNGRHWSDKQAKGFV